MNYIINLFLILDKKLGSTLHTVILPSASVIAILFILMICFIPAVIFIKKRVQRKCSAQTKGSISLEENPTEVNNGPNIFFTENGSYGVCKAVDKTSGDPEVNDVMTKNASYGMFQLIFHDNIIVEMED